MPARGGGESSTSFQELQVTGCRLQGLISGLTTNSWSADFDLLFVVYGCLSSKNIGNSDDLF